MKFNKSQFSTYLLFVAVILCWGMAWPAGKIAVQVVSPIWVIALRTVIATIFIFMVVGAFRKLVLPNKKDLPLILTNSVLQIYLFSVLSYLGLAHVEAGQAAILAYTMPIWVTPIACVFFKEKVIPIKVVAVVLAIVGIAIIFITNHKNFSNHNMLIGNILLLSSAFVWALAILAARYMTWYKTPTELAPWQFLVGSILALITALIMDPDVHATWTHHAILAILYLGILGTGFGFWGITIVSKQLPAITTSIGLLGVPVINLVVSNLALHESISLEKLIALSFIITALILVIIADRKLARKKLQKTKILETEL